MNRPLPDTQYIYSLIISDSITHLRVFLNIMPSLSFTCVYHSQKVTLNPQRTHMEKQTQMSH